jgi:hypothetical protein
MEGQSGWSVPPTSLMVHERLVLIVAGYIGLRSLEIAPAATGFIQNPHYS